jgi:hypothetical protein
MLTSLKTTSTDVFALRIASPSRTYVSDGTWYVTSSFKWQGPTQVEGGSMMLRVDVRGGQFVKVVLP